MAHRESLARPHAGSDRDDVRRSPHPAPRSRLSATKRCAQLPILLREPTHTPEVNVSRSSPIHEYAVDAGHSIVEFSVGFALTHVKGRFTDWTGTILYDSITPANSSITAILQTTSLDTGWPHRDQHLRTTDFFDVEH